MSQLPGLVGYEVRGRLGQSESGVVVCAWQTHLQRLCAVKELAPALLQDADSDGGATWNNRSAPPPSGVFTTGQQQAALFAVRCVDAAHCYASGNGAFFTSDLGTTWQDISPPEGPPGTSSSPGHIGPIPNCNYLNDIEFQTPSDGWAVGAYTLQGGAGIDGLPGVGFHTVDGGPHGHCRPTRMVRGGRCSARRRPAFCWLKPFTPPTFTSPTTAPPGRTCRMCRPCSTRLRAHRNTSSASRPEAPTTRLPCMSWGDPSP